MRKAVFISGKGSNLKALIDANPNDDFFIYSNQKCDGLLWAKKRGFFTKTVSLKNTNDWKSFLQEVKNLRFSVIYLLGFMRLVPDFFLKNCGCECINIHPSFLPHFKGLGALKESYTNKKGMGCTLHIVDSKVDEGVVLFQKNLDRHRILDLDAFKLRVHAFEQKLVTTHFRLKKGLCR